MVQSESECRGWRSAADLLVQDPSAPVAVLGAPLAEGSLTPGRCDLAPAAVRAALKRMSVYDLETETDLSSLRVHEGGDVPLERLSIGDASTPLRAGLRDQIVQRDLTILLGGNNAVTRPGFQALESVHGAAGLLTLDAHFDQRDTDCGLTNGNPIQALLEDGLDGRRISQIGLLPFANTRRMHEKAKAAGITVCTARDCRARGTAALVAEELERLAAVCDVIYVDFDIDVIDRAQLPGAPGARPGGIPVQDFFDAARLVGAHAKVRAVDLTEFDPALDLGGLSALTAARWFCELLAGFVRR